MGVLLRSLVVGDSVEPASAVRQFGTWHLAPETGAGLRQVSMWSRSSDRTEEFTGNQIPGIAAGAGQTNACRTSVLSSVARRGRRDDRGPKDDICYWLPMRIVYNEGELENVSGVGWGGGGVNKDNIWLHERRRLPGVCCANRG